MIRVTLSVHGVMGSPARPCILVLCCVGDIRQSSAIWRMILWVYVTEEDASRFSIVHATEGSGGEGFWAYGTSVTTRIYFSLVI
jgi:hypothetical protein